MGRKEPDPLGRRRAAPGCSQSGEELGTWRDRRLRRGGVQGDPPSLSHLGSQSPSRRGLRLPLLACFESGGDRCTLSSPPGQVHKAGQPQVAPSGLTF